MHHWHAGGTLHTLASAKCGSWKVTQADSEVMAKVKSFLNAHVH